MIFDRKAVFDGLRAHFDGFDGTQIIVIDLIVTEFEKRKFSDVRWLAYMLATVWHECRFRPVREIGRGKGKRYGRAINGLIYYGRGLVQLTWIENYRLLGNILNVPLVEQPDLALQPVVATAILFEGMTTALSARGDFTGRDLSQFFNAKTDDPVGARRIINGTDKAKLIAGHHAKILKVLQNAKRAVRPAAEGGGIAAGAGAAVVVTAAASGVNWLVVAGLTVVAMIIGFGIYVAIKRKQTP
jgi:putative chitinase